VAGKEYYRKALQNMTAVMMKIFLGQALLLVSIPDQQQLITFKPIDESEIA
jgi:preprotein translocase subunit SecG